MDPARTPADGTGNDLGQVRGSGDGAGGDDRARYPPAAALFAGRDGLAVIRRIADEAGEWLAPGGVVVCEIGATQGVFATHLFASLGGHVERDLADRDRFVVGVQARSNE